MTPAFWRWWLTRQAGPLVGQRRSFTFDDSGIHEGEHTFRATRPWTAFSVMRVTSDGVRQLRDAAALLPALQEASPCLDVGPND